MQTNTFYNPTTNEIVTGVYQMYRTGFESCGHKKFAEAMTFVDADLRFELWSKTKTNEYRGIPLNKCSTRLRNQLQKIGITYTPEKPYYEKYISPGLKLLRKILSK